MEIVLNVFDSIINKLGRKNISWVLVALGLILTIVNYSHYSIKNQNEWQLMINKDGSILTYLFVFYKMFMTYLYHLETFFTQFYNEDLKYLSFDNYKKMGETIKDLYTVYVNFFLNILSLICMFLAVFIRTEGSFIKRFKTPFAVSIFMITLIIFLSFFANDLSVYINSIIEDL